jgi:histone H3/H4
MGELPRAAVFRLMKKASGARMEKEAIEELGSFLEDTAIAMSKRAAELAKFAKRKTVTKEDVSLAATE